MDNNIDIQLIGNQLNWKANHLEWKLFSRMNSQWEVEFTAKLEFWFWVFYGW